MKKLSLKVCIHQIRLSMMCLCKFSYTKPYMPYNFPPLTIPSNTGEILSHLKAPLPFVLHASHVTRHLSPWPFAPFASYSPLARPATHLLRSWSRQNGLLGRRGRLILSRGPAVRVAREGNHAVLLRRARFGDANRRSDVLSPLAALADGAHEPRGLPGALPAPVLLEVIFAGLPFPAGDINHDTDEPVEYGVDEDAAGRS